MTKRRIENHEACLKAFSEHLRKDVKDNLKAWAVMDPIQAQARRMAYANIVFLLKQTATEHDISLAELGLAGYEIPEVESV